MDILTQLQDIFRDIFDDDALTVNERTSAQDIEDWDSLAQLQIMIAAEKVFQVKFTPEEIQGIQSVQGMIDAVESKRANK